MFPYSLYLPVRLFGVLYLFDDPFLIPGNPAAETVPQTGVEDLDFLQSRTCVPLLCELGFLFLVLLVDVFGYSAVKRFMLQNVLDSLIHTIRFKTSPVAVFLLVSLYLWQVDVDITVSGTVARSSTVHLD